MRRNFLVIAAVVLAGILIWLAIVLRPGNQNQPTSPVLGTEGSEHSHARFLVVIFDEPVNFSRQEYMLKSPLVHFEEGDGTIIHKHATGVTLDYFFKTLGMELTPDCVVSSDKTRYCTDSQNFLSIFVNPELFNEQITDYELKAGDKILVNYGDDNQLDLEIKLNYIADLPNDLYR